jgi:putative spermidine/putrescine transport system ATP-binding protein
MPAQLSGGQQQRVALARALAYDPPLLLMDEPLSALDKKLREEIQYEIKRIHTETGVTILYVTHDQEEALRLSDRIALFNHGRIEQVGTGRDLYEAPRTRFVAGFIGNSNFIKGSVTRRTSGSGQVTCPDGSTIDGVSLADLPPGESDALVMVRPDRVKLARSRNEGTGLSGVVTDATFLGDSLHVAVATKWGETIDIRSPLDAPEAVALVPGDRVELRFDPSQVRVFSPHA